MISRAAAASGRDRSSVHRIARFRPSGLRAGPAIDKGSRVPISRPRHERHRRKAMIPTGQDSLRTRSTLEVEGKTYAYYSLNKAGEALGNISRLPFSMKVLLENLLRFEDGKTVTREDLQAIVDWLKER